MSRDSWLGVFITSNFKHKLYLNFNTTFHSAWYTIFSFKKKIKNYEIVKPKKTTLSFSSVFGDFDDVHNSKVRITECGKIQLNKENLFYLRSINFVYIINSRR